ncbi:hypothetical protein PIB30_112459, partial [Stylosanthes scabra]|nr:hypothetical protein [Stylosanthes scabra]
QNPLRFYTPGKPFHLYPRLEAIFGKDRANGGFAMPGADAEETVQESDLPMKDDDTDMLNLGGQDSDSQFQSSPVRSSSAAKRARTNSTKRTRGEDAMVILAESMKTVVGEQGKHIQVLANALSGVNEEVNIGRTLNKLGFSTEEIVAIALKFGQQSQLKDIFWSLEDVQKAAYVKTIMHN